MTVELAKIQKYLKGSLQSYYAHPRYEDAMQEGMIRAWRDVYEPDEERTELHIMHRAKQWSLAYLQQHYKRPTGAPPLSRDGIGTASGDRNREKVVNYYQEFWDLHDRRPTTKEISEAVGISNSEVNRLLKNHREGRFDHAMYDKEGDHSRIAASYFSEVHLDSLVDGQEEGDASRVALFEDPFNLEDHVLTQLDFESLLARVPEPHNHTLYLRFVMGYTSTEIAHVLGHTKHLNQYGVRKINQAVAAAKKILFPEEVKPFDPYTGTCKKGHERTPENIRFVKFEDGRYRRDCLICEETRLKRYQKKPKEKVPAKLCKRGHEIDGVRKSGARYCKTCNYEGNLRRLQEKREKTA